MLLMENSKNMENQIKDQTMSSKPNVARPYKSINTEKHERGINQHGSLETIRNYKEFCKKNAQFKNMELHERHFELRNSEPSLKAR